MHLKETFSKFVGQGHVFLAGSLATVESATGWVSEKVLDPLTGSALSHGLNSPNAEMVALGGTGLAIGAGLAILKKFEAMPYALLPANALLTGNGLHMALTSGGDPALIASGAMLASANSIGGYGTLNYHMLKGQIAPDAHGAGSVIAGVQIAGAGAVLNDPLLASIGTAFAFDGAARSVSEGRMVHQPYCDAVKHLAWALPTKAANNNNTIDPT